ncbi:MAG: SPOR domain-containing protein [Sphingomonas sp.]|nr:SPOR domain-containing protein [Sphingomonas sp.]
MGSKCARLAAALAMVIAASAASATANISVAPESPGSALSRHIRVLASKPRDFTALIGAGQAALALGDVQAAAGFFGRAEEAYPNEPAAKAGLGAAMAHMGDADGAIFYFDQATRLGATPLTIALDRGLAKDLNGDLAAAQRDYRLAIQSLNSDEGRRRLALSLAIGRDRAAAIAAIQPLLNRRDPAAQRTRAFVLALVGDQAGAAEAIEAVMPGGSARFAPFFNYLPYLSVQEKAAAVHLGMFPDNAAERVAQLQAAPVQQGRPVQQTPPVQQVARARQPAPPGQVAIKSTPRLGEERSQGGAAGGPTEPSAAAGEPVQLASNEATSAVPGFTLPSQAASSSSSSSVALPQASASTTASSPQASVEASVTPTDNLSGIDKLLQTMAEAPPPPPAPRPKVERTSEREAAAKKAADRKAAEKKAAEKKARDAKLAAEKKAREEEARLGVRGTYWVQLAGGSNQDRMGSEYRKLSAKAGKLLKSRPGYVTEGKEYFRLVVGPFDSKSESQAFVNSLAKEGVDSFSWTRTPAQIKIEKLSSK